MGQEQTKFWCNCESSCSLIVNLSSISSQIAVLLKYEIWVGAHPALSPLTRPWYLSNRWLCGFKPFESNVWKRNKIFNQKNYSKYGCYELFNDWWGFYKFKIFNDIWGHHEIDLFQVHSPGFYRILYCYCSKTCCFWRLVSCCDQLHWTKWRARLWSL